jgi:hypothetical protein
MIPASASLAVAGLIRALRGEPKEAGSPRMLEVA